MGLFLLSIIVASCLPLLTASLDNIRLTKTKAEMVYIIESSMEKIVNYNSAYPNEEYIFNTAVSELIDMFSKNESITVDLPLYDDSCNYVLRISKESFNPKLWHIRMEISSKEEKRIENVTLQSLIPTKL